MRCRKTLRALTEFPFTCQAKASFSFDQCPGVEKCSDAAKTEILEECEEVFSQLQKVR